MSNNIYILLRENYIFIFKLRTILLTLFSNSNVAYENNCYFTNFRILVINNKTVYDIPFAVIIHHYIKVK